MSMAVHAAQPIRPMPRQEEGKSSQSFSNSALKTWNIVWDKGSLVWQGITMLFFRCIGFFAPKFTLRLEALWGHVSAIYLRMKAALLQENILELESQNRELRDRVQEFMIANTQLHGERDDAIGEKDRLLQERAELILGRAPVLVERDRLREENGQLTQERAALQTQNGCLSQERDTAIAEQRRLERERDAFRSQLERAPHYQQLQMLFEEFNRHYQKIENTGDDASATQFALEQLVPALQSQRAASNEKLRAVIAQWTGPRSACVLLEEILRISEAEMSGLERTSRALHLIAALRKNVTTFLDSNGMGA